MSEPIPDELRTALDSIRAAQARLDEDRAKVREQILAAEPTWGPCLQCGHTWRSRNIRRRLGKPPRRCPNCLSSYWFDADYVPRKAPEVAAGAESNGGGTRGGAISGDLTAPTPAPAPANTFEMSPPPKFELDEDMLDLMKKARKEEE